MDDRSMRKKGSRIPAGILGAVVLIALAEFAVARSKVGTFGGSQWSYEVARETAESGDRDFDVLCFGDSLLKQGLAPPVLETAAGIRAYNFAIAGGQAPGEYFLLRKALASGIKPRAIVVEFFPKLMATEPEFNVENWPFVASPAECFELARLARSPGFLADLALRELLPSVRCRNSIRANVLAALNGSFPMFAHEVRSARRNWAINRGAEIVASRPGRVDNLDLWMQGYFPKFSCAKANRTYIKRLLDLAGRHEIPVFWVLPPYQPALQARCEQSGFDAAHVDFIRTLQARYPGLYVVDGRHAGYDPSVFTDLHHLGREGAAIFSGELAGVLRRHRDDPSRTPRWVEMPGYRPVAGAPLLEDMEESRRRTLDVAKGPGALTR